MEYCDDDREYIWAGKGFRSGASASPMPSSHELNATLHALINRHTATVDSLMARRKAGELSAGEVWAKFPGWPRLQHGTYVTSLTGVHSPWMGGHDLYHLYMDVVRETGGDPNAGGLARPGAKWILSPEDSTRKNQEDEEYRTLQEAVKRAFEEDRHREASRRAWGQTRELQRRDEEEERIARIVRRVLKEDRLRF